MVHEYVRDTIKLKDCIIQLNTGLNPRKNFSLGNGDIKYITAKNLTQAGYIDFSTCDYIDAQAKEIIHRRSDIQKGDVLFASRAPIGHCHLITEEPNDYDIGESIFCIRVNKDIILPEFLCLYLSSDLFIKSASKRVTGSVIQEIRISDLLDTDVIIPDKYVQKKISECIGVIDEKIESNKLICSDLEGMAKLLYDYWFVQFDFPDENGKPYKSSGGKMVWNEDLKREIPAGWEVKDILDVCDIVDCLHSKKPDYCYEKYDCYLLTLENLTKEGYIDLTNKYYISQSDYKVWTSKIEVSEGDFVVTNAGRAGDIGRIPSGVKCAIGRNLTAIRPTKINSIYLNMFLHSFYVQSQIMSNLDQGSFFTSFNVYAIKKLKVLVPDGCMMEKALLKFTDVIMQIEAYQAENQQLASLRDFLLPMLMNGQVKIKNTDA